MEVQIQAYSQDAEKKQEKQKCFNALFSMVALDSVTRKPVPVNRLAPETEEEKARYQKGTHLSLRGIHRKRCDSRRRGEQETSIA